MSGIFNSEIFNNAIFNTDEDAALAWPSDILPHACEFFLRQNTGALVSPITRTSQILHKQGELWVGKVSLLLDREPSQRLDAFLDSVEGASQSFTVWDFSRPEPLGVNEAASNVTVLGTADAGDMSFDTEGWDASVLGQLLAGDYIGVGGYLYRLSQDANSDGDGEATVQLTSPLKSSLVEGDVVTRTRPTVSVRLVDDSQPIRSSDAEASYYELSVVEAW